ncbi:hypothetical protein [Allocoleopsis sp.]|uniref:hypothetical protein n=1 Tax=Allocoleopsis sp. TaxID=3088169 RepID=UPI002FD03C26
MKPLLNGQLSDRKLIETHVLSPYDWKSLCVRLPDFALARVTEERSHQIPIYRCRHR